jgi:hypothetical protein
MPEAKPTSPPPFLLYVKTKRINKRDKTCYRSVTGCYMLSKLERRDGRRCSILRDFTHKYKIYVLHRVTVQSAAESC